MSALHVELLTKARRRIEKGQHGFLCFALSHAANNLEEREAIREIKDHIRILLCGCGTLGGWLEVKHGIRAYSFCEKYRNRMRETRLAWIDWLIEEWRDAP